LFRDDVFVDSKVKAAKQSSGAWRVEKLRLLIIWVKTPKSGIVDLEMAASGMVIYVRYDPSLIFETNVAFKVPYQTIPI